VTIIHEWNESALILSAFENRLTASRLSLTHHAMQTNPAAEQNKNILNGSKVRRFSLVEKEKVYDDHYDRIIIINNNKQQQQQLRYQYWR